MDRWAADIAEAWREGQATDPAVVRRWLDRLVRLVPKDPLALAAAGAAALQAGDAVGAAGLFTRLAALSPAGWPGLAISRLMLGQWAEARAALAWALQSAVPDAALADAVAGIGQWCGLQVDGTIVAADGTDVALDGVPLTLAWHGGRAALPDGWRQGETLTCTGPDGPRVGSSLPVALARMEAFADWAVAGVPDGAPDGTPNGAPNGVAGWAWYPADPGHAATVWVETAGRRIGVTATEPMEGQTGLFRPKRFHLALPDVDRVAVRGPDGRHVLGSPLVRLPARPTVRRRKARAPLPHDAGPEASRRVAVVVPVHGGVAHVRACLDSVIATVPADVQVHVVDDASAGPSMAVLLAEYGARIDVTGLAANVGFPGAANAGLRAAAGQDVVLLNSDTLVPPGWLSRLRAAAYSAPDVGSATPLSNDATILSVPSVMAPNPVPDAAGVVMWDRLVQRVNGGATAEIPTGHGFCLYLRRDCLDQIGLLDADAFAQGYGEENDWCWRARRLGWRHVAALGVFVGHVGGQSFGPGRAHLLGRNLAVLNRLHPGYDAAVAAYVAADPLAAMRRQLDEQRWTHGCRVWAVVMITHRGGGGVDRAVAARAAVVQAAGGRAIILRPIVSHRGVLVQDAAAPDAYPALRYGPGDAAALAALLQQDGVRHVELHHRRGHDLSIHPGLSNALRVPADVIVHDYAAFCQQIALVGPQDRYCGEPDVPGCVVCVAEKGSALEEAITMPALLARSATDLVGARRVIAPSHDAARRMGRHFSGVHVQVEPWELPARLALTPGAGARVCIVGAIGVEKGYAVLLACAADARARALPLEFVVVGYTIDDSALMAAGPIHVTGPYAEAEAEALIRAQGAALGLLPSIWPETWCYALSALWSAGLPVVAFDLGAPAERMRTMGQGTLLPLGLPPGLINDALLAAIACGNGSGAA